jgi:hypothetical protein
MFTSWQVAGSAVTRAGDSTPPITSVANPAADPASRVVYVDKEPIAVEYSRLLLRDNERASVIHADLRDPDDLLGRPEIAQQLDLSKPIGLLTVSVWHFVSDADDPAGLMARYRAVLAPGSHLALSHVTRDGASRHTTTGIDHVRVATPDEIFPRDHEQVTDMFAGFELVAPVWSRQRPGAQQAQETSPTRQTSTWSSTQAPAGYGSAMDGHAGGSDAGMPNAVRMLDYLLGDGRNFAGDRRLADLAQRVVPDLGLMVRLNRTFMRRAVTHLVAAGIRQFLDLSAGTTAVGNAHEIAQAIDPACRVTYVHADPVSVVHTRQLLAGAERTAVVEAAPRDVKKVMAANDDAGLLDLTAPVGVLMVAVLEGMPDSTELVNMVAGYRERIAPGSHVVVSHFTGDHRPTETAAIVELMRASAHPVHPRTHEEVSRLFTGFELLAPGLVDASRWHAERPPDPAEQRAGKQYHVGVGRKPEVGPP